MNDLEQAGRDAQMEQSEAAQRSIGRVQGAYYRGLVEGGVPPDVAAIMTQQFSWISWHKVQYPDHPPMVMPYG